MQIYQYNSPAGIFEIRQTGHLRYELWIKDEMLGSYVNPGDAAMDVAAFDTGYVEWDRLENELEDIAKTLDDWTEVTEASPGP